MAGRYNEEGVKKLTHFIHFPHQRRQYLYIYIHIYIYIYMYTHTIAHTYQHMFGYKDKYLNAYT